ncbi:MAG TPA: thymidylate kinase, partial [Alphaproteobacteria bacterium]|nr:thymidylate kinase [Alphaproteobacteria bacterium]
DRFESRERLADLIAGHALVILDRYVASNMAYNAAKLPAAERDELIGWLDETEFGIFGLPRPDLTCLVATRPETADDLVGRKGARSYTAAARDLHEADRPFMTRVAEVYEALAAREPDRWLRVDPADAGGALRSPDAIADEVWQALAPRLQG